ncbi:T9SS type A sorting domain-containing protein [candidate division KSB1 bacterium]|nr:T9SS type A sorting domain-containing protein [candidate division KSB1 bacterium]
MKLKYHISFLVGIIISASLFAQLDSLNVQYPLNTNDYWEYLEQPSPLFTIYKRIIGDTLMPNGHLYKIIRENDDHNPTLYKYSFQRISDSSEVYQYVHWDSIPDEEKLFELNVKVGDRWKYPKNSISGWLSIPLDSAYLVVDRIYNEEVLGRELGVVYIIPSAGGLDERTFALADSLGIRSWGFEGGEFVLQGARINGREYGVITSGVESSSHHMDYNSLCLYPNPFNQSTAIYYNVPESAGGQNVRLELYNTLGQRVRILLNKPMSSGEYWTLWNGKDEQGVRVASGIYILNLMAKNVSLSRKITLTR